MRVTPNFSHFQEDVKIYIRTLPLVKKATKTLNVYSEFFFLFILILVIYLFFNFFVGSIVFTFFYMKLPLF